MQWLCSIGLHKWGKPDIQPNPFPVDMTNTAKRACRRCGQRQWWLPGYGGSELGCWLNEKAPGDEAEGR